MYKQYLGNSGYVFLLMRDILRNVKRTDVPMIWSGDKIGNQERVKAHIDITDDHE